MLLSPKLSICIATFNRADFISQTLDSIVKQITPEIEIVIVDGASTDNTEEVITRYLGQYNNVKYFKLPCKGGVDVDYDKAVSLSNGLMCWLFTDDDTLKDGAIKRVLSEIYEETKLIVVNAEVRDKELNKILTKSQLNISNDLRYDIINMNELFITTFQYLSFIGGVVINRNMWVGRNKKDYYGTEFIHLGVIFQEYINGKCVVISEPYIIIRFGNAQWTERSFKIWMFNWPNLVWSFNQISDSAKSKIISKDPWRDLGKLLIYRLNGEYNIDIYKKYLSKKPEKIYWKLCAYLISIFSKNILRKVRIALKKVKIYNYG